jgi:hypothetical protein
VDAVTPQALGLALELSQTSSLCMFNIVEDAMAEYPDTETDTDAVPEVHWEPVFTTIRAGCYLRAFRTTGQTIRLRLRTGGLSEQTCQAILTGTYRRVIEASTAG